MALKTYLSHRPNLSLSWPRPGVTPGSVKETVLYFSDGDLETDDKAEQDFIESTQAFKDELITLAPPAPTPLEAAQAKAKAARATANAAVKEAEEAEAAVAALKKSPAAV